MGEWGDERPNAATDGATSALAEEHDAAIDEEGDLVVRHSPAAFIAHRGASPCEMEVRARGLVVPEGLRRRIDDVDPASAAAGDAADGEQAAEEDSVVREAREAARVEKLALRAILGCPGAHRANDVQRPKAEEREAGRVALESIRTLAAVETPGDGAADWKPRQGIDGLIA